ncbi:hypothetical protein MIR68_010096 [Amoeboaphelidium protococcarum]|nr:hypothetical protein MIR68_010096 [Amoeboaphelidium protococcarum]
MLRQALTRQIQCKPLISIRQGPLNYSSQQRKDNDAIMKQFFEMLEKSNVNTAEEQSISNNQQPQREEKQNSLIDEILNVQQEHQDDSTQSRKSNRGPSVVNKKYQLIDQIQRCTDATALHQLFQSGDNNPSGRDQDGGDHNKNLILSNPQIAWLYARQCRLCKSPSLAYNFMSQLDPVNLTTSIVHELLIMEMQKAIQHAKTRSEVEPLNPLRSSLLNEQVRRTSLWINRMAMYGLKPSRSMYIDMKSFMQTVVSLADERSRLAWSSAVSELQFVDSAASQLSLEPIKHANSQ